MTEKFLKLCRSIFLALSIFTIFSAFSLGGNDSSTHRSVTTDEQTKSFDRTLSPEEEVLELKKQISDLTSKYQNRNFSCTPTCVLMEAGLLYGENAVRSFPIATQGETRENALADAAADCDERAKKAGFKRGMLSFRYSSPPNAEPWQRTYFPLEEADYNEICNKLK